MLVELSKKVGGFTSFVVQKYQELVKCKLEFGQKRVLAVCNDVYDQVTEYLNIVVRFTDVQ